MEITPLTPHLGAEIRGVDLSAPLDNETFAGIHQAFLDWSVLVFRDQELSRDQHKDFGRKFGKLHTHPMNHQRDGDDEILVVKTTKDSAYTAGNGWHTDVTCDEYPPMGSMLYMALIGLIIATVVNLFMQSATFDYIISGIGILLFSGLTAYDNQKLMQIGTQVDPESEGAKKLAVMGALTLYLDFINLFLFLLRFFGGGDD